MATDNIHRYGFRWVGNKTGGQCPVPLAVPLASGYSPTAGGTNVGLHVGDPIIRLSTGYFGIGIGTEGSKSLIFGIIHSFNPILTSGLMTPQAFFPFGGGVYGTNFVNQTFVNVIPAANQYFACDCDDNVTFTTYATYLAAFGENVDMVFVADTSNSSDPKADPKLDISTHHVTTATQWRIVRDNPKVYQDFGGANVSLIVEAVGVQEAPYDATGT